MVPVGAIPTLTPTTLVWVRGVRACLLLPGQGPPAPPSPPLWTIALIGGTLMAMGGPCLWTWTERER